MNVVLRTCLITACAFGLRAQSGVPEPLSAWPYLKEFKATGGLSEIVLDRDVLDKARADQSDLRLYNSTGKELPYALRVRSDQDTRTLFAGKEFNRTVLGNDALISCDLGTQPQEHNEVQIATTGNNFRRMVEVQGSADGLQWSTLASQALIFRFNASGRGAEQLSVNYPVSRFRYVRVRVQGDPQADRGAPQVTGISVNRSIQAKGETVSFPATFERREADPVHGRPASIWRIDLGGRIPLQSLALTFSTAGFSRPFQLDVTDDNGQPIQMASGDLTSREDQGGAVQISFREDYARHLKLSVTDDRNEPLVLTEVSAISAVRQLVFDAPAGQLKLYYGNPKGIAPHYDVAAKLPAEAPWQRLQAGPQLENPEYRPPDKPLSERSPWLIYVVLVLACGALAAILVNLARAAKLKKAEG